MDPADNIEPRSKRPGGRPTTYDPVYVGQVTKLCALGATDEEIAEFFGVHRATLYRWKHEHPEFCDAITIGKGPADDRTERSLYAMANGYHVIEQQAIKLKNANGEERVEVVEVQRYVPPVPAANIFCLKNRRSSQWRDTKQFEASGPNAGSIQSEHRVTFRVIDPREDLQTLARMIEGKRCAAYTLTVQAPIFA